MKKSKTLVATPTKVSDSDLSDDSDDKTLVPELVSTEDPSNVEEQDSEEIPSSLESPAKKQEVSHLVKKSKTRVSTTRFKRALQDKKDRDPGVMKKSKTILETPTKASDSDLSEDSDDTTLVPDPVSSDDVVSNVSNRKKIYKTPPSRLDKSDLESSDIPSIIGSPDDVRSPSRHYKPKSRVSTTAFKKVLEDIQEQDSEEIPSSLESPAKKQEVSRHVNKSKSRMSTTAFNKALQSQKEQDPGEMKKSKALLETPTSNVIRRKRIKRPDSDEDDGPILNLLPSPTIKEIEKNLRSSSRASTRSTATRKTPSPFLKKIESISGSSRRASESKSSSNVIKRKNITRPESDEDDDPVLKLPSTSNRPPSKSLSAFSRIILDSDSESESEEPDDPLSKQMTESVNKFLSPVIEQVEEGEERLSGNRLRRSLQYESLATKEDKIKLIEDDLLSINEVEETPPNDNDSLDEKSTEEKIEEETNEELSAKSRRLSHSSPESSKTSSRKSRKIGMSPTNRYPALKNSTVVAGGADLGGRQLFSLSPIILSEQGSPTTANTNVTSPTSRNVQTAPLLPLSTPAPFARKRKHSITQSPMFVDLMKSSVNKATSKVKHPQPSSPSTPAPASASSPAASRVSVAKTTQDKKQLASTTPALSRASAANIASKGLSSLNPGKGKSLVKSVIDEKAESSDTEWKDEEDDEERPIPSCIRIANEMSAQKIEDRSKDFVPIEERLKNDKVFQAKVKYQRAKVAAQKAEEAAAEAKMKAAKKKPRAVSTKKKEEDNITSVAFNKANFRFYAGSKVTKDALDAVHGLVGEWFDFTLDQMENFCIDEGIPSLDSWEDCFKMMKRQGIVKNYMEYSGLCHELLLNDECELLLLTTPPPELYEWRRKAKREHK